MKINFSDVLESNGKYYYFQALFICLTTCVVVWANLNYVFVAGNLNYRCKVQECESPEQPFTPDWWPSSEIDHCSMPVLNLTLYESSNTCTKKSFTHQIKKCTEWTYETNDTTVAELNLACQHWKKNMVGTVHAIGMMLSVLVSGWMADRFGRKLTLIICSVGYIVGCFKLLATSYPVYLTIEFLEGSFSGSVLGSGAVLLYEISPIRCRTFAAVMLEFFFNSGELSFGCLGMVVKNWRTLVPIIYSPCLFFLSYIFILKESPRWYTLHGKFSQTKKILKLMAKMNNVKIDVHEIECMTDSQLKQLFNLEKEVKKEGLKAAFSSWEMLKRMAMGFVTRFTSSFIYNGLIINSVYLPGDKYTNFIIVALSSYPGVVLSLYIMNKFGKKWPLIYGYAMSGIITASIEFIPNDYKICKIITFLTAKMLMCACFSVIVAYTLEVFPTSVRGSMTGMCTLASNMGTVVAPLTPSLATISPLLPPLSFGCSALLSTFLLCLTPETTNLPLPDIIKQIEKRNKVETTENSMAKVGPQINFAFEQDFESRL